MAIYIYVDGWWTKPTFADPLTDIQEDGGWVCDITTGGIDERATMVAAFLVPVGYAPPVLSGGKMLPPTLYDSSVASIKVTRVPQ